jgi:hypothetical protein
MLVRNASVALTLGVLACCQPVAPNEPAGVASAPTATPSDAAPKAAPSRPLLPPPDAPPPPPIRPPPRGTSDTPGAIRQILAIDGERAIVVFTREGTADTPPPILAAMRADGTIDWSVELGGQPLPGRTSTGIELVGDAVSIAIGHPGELHDRIDRIEIYGIADGKRRATVNAEVESYARETIVDRGLRIDTFLASHYGANEIIATDANGVVWRKTLHGWPHTEIVGLPKHVAVRLAVEGELMRTEEWHVFDRRRGSRVAVVPGYDSCSDAGHWFVRQDYQLHAVDLGTFSTRPVLNSTGFPTRDLPGLGAVSGGDAWVLRDCTIVEGQPFAFAQLGMIEALVGVEANGDWRIQPLGIRRYREGDVDPLPDRLHPVMALGGLDESDAYDLILADLRKAERTGSNAPETRIGLQALLRFDDDDQQGYVVATRDVLGVIDGSTGAMTGHHIRRDTMALHRTQRAGRHLWLPPASGMQLGRAAPTVLDLRAPTGSAAVRGALAADLGDDRRGKPALGCDSMNTIRYDGVETAHGLGPVSPSREPPFEAEHMAQAARGFACASPSSIVTLLAWAIVQDDRPLRNHDALMMIEDIVDGRPLYTVVSMYRHATNRDWGIAVSFHDPSSPMRRFARRPTTADLDAFIDQSSFAMVDPFGPLLAGNVLDANWRAVTGEAALRRFPAAVEQID